MNWFRRRPRRARLDRGPLRVMFVHTELLLGGAETLLLELIRNMDREKFTPEICLLQRLGPLGMAAAEEVSVTTGVLRHKYDVAVVVRLAKLMRAHGTDAVVTVGTGGDRMFWGRLAAWTARVPVILSAIHSTGYPHGLERSNRLLAPITDGFIGVAQQHSEYLVEHEGCPRDRVFTVYNGVDTNRFRPADRRQARRALGWQEDVPIAGIVAALRPEKQHVLLIEAWADVIQQVPNAQLKIVGEGDEREKIESVIRERGVGDSVELLGRRDDVDAILPALDVMALSSKMEASPASTLEASACGVAVVAPNVGSLSETVCHRRTGLLYPGSDGAALTASLVSLLSDRERAAVMGETGREFVERRFSLDVMVRGYEELITGIYDAAWNGTRFLAENLDAAMQSSASPERISPSSSGDIPVS